MAGQEARDDEREALVTAAYNSVTGQDDDGWNPDIILTALFGLYDAAWKHPEPEITDRARELIAEVRRREFGTPQTKGPVAAMFLMDLASALADALEAALRVPVGEGEQG